MYMGRALQPKRHAVAFLLRSAVAGPLTLALVTTVALGGGEHEEARTRYATAPEERCHHEQRKQQIGDGSEHYASIIANSRGSFGMAGSVKGLGPVAVNQFATLAKVDSEHHQGFPLPF